MLKSGAEIGPNTPWFIHTFLDPHTSAASQVFKTFADVTQKLSHGHGFYIITTNAFPIGLI